jgi:hypothetical protein
MVRRFDAAGTPAHGEVVVNTSTEHHAAPEKAPDVAVHPDGSSVVLWHGDTLPLTSDTEVLFRRIGTGGAYLTGETVANETGAGDQDLGSVVADASGLTVVWFGFTGCCTVDGEEILGRRFGLDGAQQSGEVRLNAGTTGDQSEAAVAAVPGGFVVGWFTNDVDDVVVRRFDATLQPDGGDVTVNTASGTHSGMRLDASGSGVAAAWIGPDADDEGIYARAFAVDGGGGGGGGAGGGGGGGGLTAPVPPPSPPAPVVVPVPRPVVAPPRVRTPSFASLVTLPSTRRCVSRRRFRIRLRQPGGVRIASAEVRLNRRRVATRRGRRVTAPIDLRGLPRGRFTVTIRIVTTTGRRVTGTRRYRTCTPKRPSGRRIRT